MPRPAPKTEKRCPDCKETKTLEQFYKGKSYDGGYSPYCKECSRARNNGRWVEEREKMRKCARDCYHRNKDNHAEKTRSRAREYLIKMRAENPALYRAKKFFDVKRNEVSPNITKEYLEALFRNTTHCQCCGKELQLGYEPRSNNKYRSNPSAPSVDRVNNLKGYSRNNIAVICWECNYRKTDLSIEDIERLSFYVRKYGDLS